MIIFGLLILLNTYPLTVSRDLVFTSKQSSLGGQTQVVAASLSTLEVLRNDNVSQTLGLLELSGFTRIVITDAGGQIVYDTADGGGNVGKYALFSEIVTALGGMDVFYCQFYDGAFMSHAASPVGYEGAIVGAVYLYEYDAEQGGLIQSIRLNLQNLSIAICVFSLFIAMLFSKTLTRRLTAMVSAMAQVEGGDYNYRLTVSGGDELADLGRAFNSLTDRIQETEELRRRFVSDASHELKTPLASIRLLTDSIVQNETMDTETVREFVQDIGQEADRLTRVAEKLLSLTRLDGEVQPEPGAADVKLVVENTLHMLAPLAAGKDVRLDVRLEEGCFVKVTEDDLYQIIFNLAENGIKYNVQGGKLYIRLYQVSGTILLEVEDTGIGIPAEDAPHIFDRFYRVDKARSRELGGSGLGLSIVKDTVLRYDGQVEVAVRASGGSRFTVRFPACEAPEPDVPARKRGRNDETTD